MYAQTEGGDDGLAAAQALYSQALALGYRAPDEPWEDETMGVREVRAGTPGCSAYMCTSMTRPVSHTELNDSRVSGAHY